VTPRRGRRGGGRPSPAARGPGRTRGVDASERDHMVVENLGLVRAVARRFGAWSEPDDLFQAGCIGLLKAVDRFDPSRGVKLSTYSVPLILGEMRAYVRGRTALKLGPRGWSLAREALRARDRLRAELGREPTISEVAGESRAPPEDVVLALEALESPSDIDDAGEPRARSLGGAGASWEEAVHLRDALARLPERERKVVAWRFFYEKTQEEVARSLGVSQAQVSRIEKRAVARMRSMLDETG